jgi:hypothetical protein
VRSSCGVAALGLLLGVGEGFSTQKSTREKLEPINNIVALLEKYLNEDFSELSSAGITSLSSVPQPVVVEVFSYLKTSMIAVASYFILLNSLEISLCGNFGQKSSRKA